MHDIKQLTQLLERHIKDTGLPSEPSNLYAPIAYTLESGGKRIRPLMVLLATQMYSDKVENAINVALAIEVFHNFTLLHDDIMDNARVRRARATVCKKWSNNIAILSGDAMLIHSYRLLAKCRISNIYDVIDSFNTLAALVCEGQQYDMDFESQDDVTIEEYLNMISLKTSALIAGSLKIGAQVAGASKEACDAMYEFGMNLGNAFQLQDDLLDTYGDESTFGKRIGGDIIEGKKTFLLLTALQIASVEQRAELESILASTTIGEKQKIDDVRDLYDTLSVRAVTEQKIDKYFKKASQIIESLDVESVRKKDIIKMATMLINRDR